MIQNSRGTSRRASNMTLHMECYSEELSPVQIERSNRARQERRELKEIVENWKSKEGTLVQILSEDCYILERLSKTKPTPQLNIPTAVNDVSSDNSVVLQPRSASPIVPRAPVVLPKTVNPRQTSNVRNQTYSVMLPTHTNRPRYLGISANSSPTVGTPRMIPPTNLPNALLRPPVPNITVSPNMQATGVVTNRNITLQNKNIMAPTVRPVTTVGVVLQSPATPRASRPRYQSPIRIPLGDNVSAARPLTTSAGVVPQQSTTIRGAQYSNTIRPVNSPQMRPTLRSRSNVTAVRNLRPVAPPVHPVAPVQSAQQAVGRPSGVLPNKTQSRQQQNPTNAKSTGAVVVDLTSDDGPSEATADTREVTFNKLIGKTFPSLVVSVRPSIHVKEINATQLAEDRSELDKKVKKVLMLTATKFSEWMIQEGLVRSDQYCQTHLSPSGEYINMKLGIYTDVSKFPYSGGYVWISPCCPSRFVSIFSGSIFEGAPHPPNVLVKLIYHWVVQTSIQNVVQWVKVDNLYVKGFYTHLRSICTAAVCEKLGKIGGPNKKVEIGVVSLGITAHGGKSRNVKVEVLGVMDPISNTIRLQAVDPVKVGEEDYKARFMKLLSPVKDWVDKDSIILTDFTIDKPTLQNMGFKTIFQVQTNDDPPPHNVYGNNNVMNYLRKNVPKMFQNTLSLLSRQIIQQFLDELVWREQWGYTPYKAFHNLVNHMAEQVKLDSNDSMLIRLSKIASDPFKSWTYKALMQPPFTPKGELFPAPAKEPEANLPNLESGESDRPPPVPPASGIDLLPQSIRDIEHGDSIKVNKGGKKRSNAAAESSEAKRIALETPGQTVVPAPPEVVIQLETYYYGQLPGDKVIIDSEYKSTETVDCPLCFQNYADNIELLKHLICHAQADGKDLPERDSELQCRYCFKFFAKQYALQVHLEEIHFKNSSSLVCRICEEKFRTRVTLISHMHTTHYHMEMPYYCGVCGFRSSQHKDVVNHFHEVHIKTYKLQCPFCLKVVDFSVNNHVMDNNIIFFINHLQKHQRKNITQKCYKCILWFVHKDILKQHQAKDHISFISRISEILPYLNITGYDIMMPKPAVSDPVASQQIISRNSFGNAQNSKNIYTSKTLSNLKITNVHEDAICNECEGYVLEDSHYSMEMSCMCCMYSTCCTKAMQDHVFIFHHDLPKNKLQFNIGRVVRLENPMYCMCGFSSYSGNCLARHLALCGVRTAYPKPYCPKIEALPSASFPPLVTLDDTDNVSEDPSDRWLKAFVPPRKEEGEGSNGAPDKKIIEPLKEPTEQSEPPSVLNILGLMQKRLSDISGANSNADQE